MKKIDFRQISDKLIGLITKVIQDKQKMVLAIGIIVLVLFVDILVILKSQIHSLSDITPKILNLKRDITTFNADLSKMRRQEHGLAVGMKSMVSSGQLTWVIEEISRLSNLQGVKISQIKPLREDIVEEPKTDKKITQRYSSAFIDLQAAAGYHQLGKFLAEIENHPVFLQVEELDIKRSKDDLFAYNIKIQFKTYIVNE